VARKREIKGKAKTLAAKKVRPAEAKKVKGGRGNPGPWATLAVPPGPNVMPVGPPQKTQ
jgi:hypothetical protein